jgi:type I restriction enzyme S subunit
MKYDLVRFGDYFELRKGFSYSGENLVEESEIGFVTLNSFIPGGGYKTDSEKPLAGEIPEKFFLSDGDVCLATTEQDEGLLASGLVIDFASNRYKSLVYSHHVAKLFPKKSGLDPKFVYNTLRIPKVRRRVAYGDAGGTVQDLPYEAIYEQLVPCPPLETQSAINSLVFDIDEKIRVNEQIIQTLEKMAVSLFKNWFLDFKVVHLNESRASSETLPAALREKFPSEFEDSEVGLIPKGWTVAKVGQLLARTKYRSEFNSSEALPVGEMPVIQQGEPMLADYSTSKSFVDASADNPYFVFGDHTCRMKLLTEQFIALPNTIVLSSLDGDTYWAYYATLDLQKFESYRRHWMELEARKIVIPPLSVQVEFGEMVKPYHNYSSQLERQNKLLRKTIESVLPMLISGELPVPSDLLGSINA